MTADKPTSSLHEIDKELGRQTDIRASRQTVDQTNRQTDVQIKKQADIISTLVSSKTKTLHFSKFIFLSESGMKHSAPYA